MQSSIRCLFFVLPFSLCMALTTRAQSPAKAPETASQGQESTGGGEGTDAASANDPGVPLYQLQFQDFYSGSLDGTGTNGKDSNTLLIRPVVPVPKIGLLPSEIIRLQIPIVTSLDNRTNLGDINGFDLFFPVSTKQLKIGVGPSFSFPTNTYHLAGDGKWELGPAGAVIYTGVKGLVLAVLVQDPISFAGGGNRPNVNTVSLQPFIVETLPKSFFVRFDPIMQFDFKHDGAATIPLNFGFGRVFKIGPQVVNAYVESEWNVARPDDNRPVSRYGLRFEVNLLFPVKK